MKVKRMELTNVRNLRVQSIASKLSLVALCAIAAWAPKSEAYQRGAKTSFQALSPSVVFVQGEDRNLWMEFPNGFVPPPRFHIDGNVFQFQAIDSANVFVEGVDGNLWLEFPSGPPRKHVDGNVSHFSAINTSTVLTVGNDHKLWRETVTGQVPPPRTLVANNVVLVQAVDNVNAFFLDTSNNLWLVNTIAPGTPVFIDGNVLEFEAIDFQHVYVQDVQRELWFEQRINGQSPSRLLVESSCGNFGAVDLTHVYVSDPESWPGLALDSLDGTPQLLIDSTPVNNSTPPARGTGRQPHIQGLAVNSVFLITGDFNSDLFWDHDFNGSLPPPKLAIDANVFF